MAHLYSNEGSFTAYPNNLQGSEELRMNQNNYCSPIMSSNWQNTLICYPANNSTSSYWPPANNFYSHQQFNFDYLHPTSKPGTSYDYRSPSMSNPTLFQHVNMDMNKTYNEKPNDTFFPNPTFEFKNLCQQQQNEISPEETGKRSPIESVTDFESEEQTKCRICKSLVASRHNYYGCVGVCISCRGFFRRSVQSGQYSLFECNRQMEGLEPGQCPIKVSINFRRNCKKCRFNRCLQLGMKVNFVLTNEERKERLMRRQRINAMSSSQSLVPKFSSDELKFANHLDEVFTNTMFRNYFAIFSDDIDNFLIFMNCSCEGKVFPFELIKKLEETDSKILNENGYKLLSFDDLAFTEQKSLLQANSKKLIGYLWALYCEPSDMMAFTESLFSYGEQHPDDVGVERVISALKQLNLTERKFRYRYNIVYSTPWAPHVDIEERHYKLTQTISNWSRKSSSHVLDSLIKVLYSMIILLSTDDTDLPADTKERISHIQMKYITLLHRYLKATYPRQANTKFAGGLMLIQLAKELYEMHSLRLPF